MLRIGVECDYKDYGIDFYYWDQYFECAMENEFLISVKNDNDFALYTCSETTIFSQNSDVTTQKINRVVMHTDTRWTDLEIDDEFTRRCHSKTDAPDTQSPTLSPSIASTRLGTPGGVEMDPAPSPALSMMDIAGIAVAGVAVIGIVIGFAVWRLKKRERPPDLPVKKNEVYEEATQSYEPGNIGFGNADSPSSRSERMHTTYNMMHSPQSTRNEENYDGGQHEHVGYPNSSAGHESAASPPQPAAVLPRSPYSPGYKDQAQAVFATPESNEEDQYIRSSSSSNRSDRQSSSNPTTVVASPMSKNHSGRFLSDRLHNSSTNRSQDPGPPLEQNTIPMAAVVYPEYTDGIIAHNTSPPPTSNTSRRRQVDP
jgi:hypothetical protein